MNTKDFLHLGVKNHTSVRLAKFPNLGAKSAKSVNSNQLPMKTIPAILPAITALALAVSPSQATTYTDATSDNYGGSEVDISSVVINNSATTLTFQINMNAAANLAPNHFANYEIGIQKGTGAGGQTAINGTFGTGNPASGNPYGNSVGISTGMNLFIGSFLNDTVDSPGFNGGAELFSYSAASGWTKIGSTAPITEVPSGSPSTTFSFALSDLGLNLGDSFKFDVWTTFGSPQSAYDALDNPNQPPGLAPFSGGSYDSATAAGSTFGSAIYTVPEPSVTMLMGAGLILLVANRLRRWSRES